MLTEQARSRRTSPTASRLATAATSSSLTALSLLATRPPRPTPRNRVDSLRTCSLSLTDQLRCPTAVRRSCPELPAPPAAAGRCWLRWSGLLNGTRATAPVAIYDARCPDIIVKTPSPSHTALGVADKIGNETRAKGSLSHYTLAAVLFIVTQPRLIFNAFRRIRRVEAKRHRQDYRQRQTRP